MEFLAIVFGFAALFAFLAALIGVPILFRRIKELRIRIAILEQRADAQASLSIPESEPSPVDTSLVDSTDLQLSETAPDTIATVDEPTAEKARALVESVGLRSAEEEPNLAREPENEAQAISGADLKDESDQTSKSATWDSLDTAKMPLLGKEKKEKGPSVFQPLLDKLLALNITAQVGAIVLIFGAVFLGKYASDIGLLTLQMRLAMMAIVSVALLFGGIYLTRRTKLYGDILQATGLAGWMVTLFVAHVLTEQISWVPTLIAGVLGVLVLGYRAVRQDSQSLAIVAYLGGFLAPFIASSEVSSLWRLFGYMVLLNSAACLISAYKPWKWFTREFTVATFGLLAALMLAEYLQNDLDQWAIQLPFAAFALVSAVMFSVLAARLIARTDEDVLKHLAGLLFGVPAATALALQTIFAENSMICAAVLAGLGAWNLLLFVWQRTWVLLGIGIVLITGSLPYALNDSLTTLVYSLEGAAFVWWATKYQRLSGFVWGVLLQGAACFFAFQYFLDIDVRETAVHISWVLFGAVIIAALLSAWWFMHSTSLLSAYRPVIEYGLLTWGLLIWVYQWTFWLAEITTRHHTIWWLTYILAGTALAIVAAAHLLKWPALKQFLRWTHIAFFAATAMYLLDYAGGASPARLLSLSALVLGLAGFRYWLANYERPIEGWEASLLWLASLGASSSSLYHAPVTQTDWNWALSILVWLGPMFFMQRIFKNTFAPNAARNMTRWVSLLVLAGFSVASLSMLGNYAPLPYWPIVHPLFIGAVAASEILFRYTRRQPLLKMIWTLLAGLLVTVEINRWLFHYVGISFTLEAWLDSALTQTVWSLIWTVIGGLLMLIGARQEHSRSRWLLGVGILGVVVLKLFVLDLAQVDTLYRILSFIGVGGLLLGIGYLAPMPKPGQLGEGAVDGN